MAGRPRERCGSCVFFYRDHGEFTLPSKIRSTPINHIPTSDLEPVAMSWGFLKEITDNFSRERLLGECLYGTFYKGLYGDGQVIAVKLYPKDGMYYNVIAREIEIHRRVHHHPNIVQLVGYCNEEEEVVEYNGKHVLLLAIHRAVCFEHVGGGSLEQYITPDMSSALDWQTQYRIIKGVCEGLRHLHEGMESHIIHMNLKPSKILLDDQKMVAKIGGFSLVRLDGSDLTKLVTLPTSGRVEYMPPEFIEKAIVTKGFDIYSLGVTILQLMTGREMYRKALYDMSSEKFIARAHAKWRQRLQKTVDGTLVEGYSQQVQKCLEIGVKCVEPDRHKRPAIGDIIHVLNETEISIPQSRNGLDSEDSELLLEVYPMELCFQAAMSSEVARNKKASMMSSSCSLQLKNKANDRVAFMLVANSPKRYLTKEPLCGVVPPRCVYTLTHTMRNNKLSSDSGSVDFFTLYSVAVDEYDLVNVDKDSACKEYDSFFKKAKEEVQEVTLKVICDLPAADRGTSSSEPTRPTFEIISTPDAQQVCFIDVHPTEPWIMTTNHAGSLRIWNYLTMASLNSFQLAAYERGSILKLLPWLGRLEKKKLAAYESVHVAKFITREKWLVIGDRDGGILVYNYEEEEDVKSFDAHNSCITTLAVHPTSPFVLSSSEDDDHMIKLWDWGNGWKCTEFGGHTDRVMQVTVNPDNNDSFASASLDGTVKIWSICSDDPNNIITLKLAEHGLCADYFTRYNRQHLIAGCDDRNAQIWELRMKERVHELEGHGDRVTAVSLHPELQILITGSLDGAVRIWNSTTYKLENIIGFNLGAVYAFGCIKGLRRIMVGCHQGIAMMKIDFP